jgi:hypothetical protein
VLAIGGRRADRAGATLAATGEALAVSVAELTVAQRTADVADAEARGAVTILRAGEIPAALAGARAVVEVHGVAVVAGL